MKHTVEDIFIVTICTLVVVVGCAAPDERSYEQRYLDVCGYESPQVGDKVLYLNSAEAVFAHTHTRDYPTERDSDIAVYFPHDNDHEWVSCRKISPHDETNVLPLLNETDKDLASLRAKVTNLEFQIGILENRILDLENNISENLNWRTE